MSEEVWERIGEGITARRREKPKPVSVGDALKAWQTHLADWFSSPTSPWERHRPMLDDLEARWKELWATRPAEDGPSLFVWQRQHMQERHSEFWYLSQIRACAAGIEHHIAAGQAGAAVHEAIMLGEYITELRMKACWELPAMWGEAGLTVRKDAAAATRKMSVAERAAIVSQIRDERGLGLRDAFRVAAQRFPEGGKVNSWKEDWYAHKKASSPTD